MDKKVEKVQVEIFGLSTTSGPGGAYAIILKEVNSNRKLPIIIGAFEAQAIALELEGITPPRPLTHDLTKTLIEYLGGNLVDVVISELRDNTFYAKLNLEVSGMNLEVDARPSDAIALAVRFRCPIYVNLTIMNEISFETGADEEEDEEGTPQRSEDFGSFQQPKFSSKETILGKLQTQLKEAIEKEDYERAAKIRDEIKKLTNEENN